MKILFIPVISILVFLLPPVVAGVLVVTQVVLSFCLGFSLKEQLYDLRVVLYYALILIFAKIVGVVFSAEATFSKDFFTDFIPTLLMLLKLLCVMQTASVVLKTSTGLQIRQDLEQMELAVRKIFHLKPATPVAQALALFICFIPQVSKNWAQIKKAWFARGGKKSIKMIVVLLPVLFSVGMKQAYNYSRALIVRQSTL